ncbi:hypothetical protein AXF42_Ash005920 [Apostasia shenzhenica]|uniref:DUF8039 domain-containing protein n=1 Tax=Apostasia shenzhenica TaxID=1088818 RepID=A0A2I0AZR9_9ASPA|nr:hypothetical protein AXF42_Ash005920 [Apostasia shenzhenica]
MPEAALCCSDSFLLRHHPTITPRPLRPRASHYICLYKGGAERERGLLQILTEMDGFKELTSQQKGTFETGQEDSTAIPEDLKIRLAYREASVAVLACYYPDIHHPFTEIDINIVSIKLNMWYAEFSGNAFSRKSNYVHSIGMHCLIACVTPNNVVAHGRMVNPVTLVVHILSMGDGTCTVIVDHVIDGSASLVFPIDDKTTIGEALRYVIPWPTWLISHDDQEKDHILLSFLNKMLEHAIHALIDESFSISTFEAMELMEPTRAPISPPIPNLGRLMFVFGRPGKGSG